MKRTLAMVGCMAAAAAVDCEGASDRYYSADGTCNNLQKPKQGKKGAFYYRGKEGVNPDRVMAGWPNVRVVSNLIHAENPAETKQDTNGLNTFAVMFGQFITHDISHNTVGPLGDMIPVDLKETGEAELYPGGYFALKSVHVEDDEGTQQNVNDATSYLDLSQVYGDSDALAADLRSMEGGLLKTSKEILDKEGLTFKYMGRYFPLCHKCVDESTTPPTPFNPIRVRPGLEPFPTAGPDGEELPACFASPCNKPTPSIKCEVNPLWSNRTGIYRDIHYNMTREWLPLRAQVPLSKSDILIVSGMRDSTIFVTGDSRNIENVNLLMMHGMFLRRHNDLARELAAKNPAWTDEELYQEARLQNTHEYQHIIYNEYLPALLGRAAPSRRGKCYDASVDATNSNLFQTASFRLHTAVPETIQLRYKNGDLQTPENGFDRAPLSDNSILSNSPKGLVNNELGGSGQIANAVHARSIIAFAGGEDAILKSLLGQPANAADNKIAEPLRTIGVNVPCSVPGPFSAGSLIGDLAATSIARGRTHGIPQYDDIRKQYNPRGSVYRTRFCKLADEEDSLKCFRYVTGEPAHKAPDAEALKTLYKKVNRIDTYTGLLTERRQSGAFVGATQARVIADQFERLRSGDRLFYTNSLSKEEIRKMRRTVTLQHLIQSTFDIEVQENAFYVDDVDVMW